LEQLRLFRFGDADALIGHIYRDMIAVSPSPEPHLAALRRVLNSVAQQIVEYLPQAFLIRKNQREVPGKIQDEPVPVRLCAPAVYHVTRQSCKVHIRAFHLECACLNARCIQQVIDQPIEAVAFFTDYLQAFAERGPIPFSIITRQGIRIPLDQRHGRL